MYFVGRNVGTLFPKAGTAPGVAKDQRVERLKGLKEDNDEEREVTKGKGGEGFQREAKECKIGGNKLIQSL